MNLLGVLGAYQKSSYVVLSEVRLVVYSFLKYGWFEINWILIRCTTAHNATVNFFPQEGPLDALELCRGHTN